MKKHPAQASSIWSAPRARRCEELAKLERLSLADIIELTGQAPDRDGMIGILDADDAGLRFTLKERNLRLRPSTEQIEARRLIEKGRLDLPCTPSALIAFNEEWGELDLPGRFVRTVQAQEAGLAGDQWRDDLIINLRARGLAEAQIDYPAFLKLTTFSREGHLDSDDYVERIENGQVVGLIAGRKWFEISAAGNPEHEIAVQFMAAARLDFPASMESLVRWIREQGLGTVEFVPDYIALLEVLSGTGVANRDAANLGDRMSVSEAASKGGKAKNAGNRKKQRDAIQLYLNGNYRTKNDAAEDIYEKLGMAYKTVRDWLKGVEKPH